MQETLDDCVVAESVQRFPFPARHAVELLATQPSKVVGQFALLIENQVRHGAAVEVAGADALVFCQNQEVFFRVSLKGEQKVAHPVRVFDGIFTGWLA